MVTKEPKLKTAPVRWAATNYLLALALLSGGVVLVIAVLGLVRGTVFPSPCQSEAEGLRRENQDLRESLTGAQIRLDQALGEERRNDRLLQQAVSAYLETFEKEKFWREEYFKVVERQGLGKRGGAKASKGDKVGL